MSERKITADSFQKGSFHDALHSGMHRAELSEQGRERVTAAMQAAVQHIEKKHDLQYGVGGNHFDEITHFLDTKYDARHELKPKERETLTSALRQHYRIPANDSAAPAAQKKEA
jgi:hypothetical protein